MQSDSCKTSHSGGEHLMFLLQWEHLFGFATETIRSAILRSRQRRRCCRLRDGPAAAASRSAPSLSSGHAQTEPLSPEMINLSAVQHSKRGSIHLSHENCVAVFPKVNLIANLQEQTRLLIDRNSIQAWEPTTLLVFISETVTLNFASREREMISENSRLCSLVSGDNRRRTIVTVGADVTAEMFPNVRLLVRIVSSGWFRAGDVTVGAFCRQRWMTCSTAHCSQFNSKLKDNSVSFTTKHKFCNFFFARQRQSRKESLSFHILASNRQNSPAVVSAHTNYTLIVWVKRINWAIIDSSKKGLKCTCSWPTRRAQQWDHIAVLHGSVTKQLSTVRTQKIIANELAWLKKKKVTGIDVVVTQFHWCSKMYDVLWSETKGHRLVVTVTVDEATMWGIDSAKW